MTYCDHCGEAIDPGEIYILIDEHTALHDECFLDWAWKRRRLMQDE